MTDEQPRRERRIIPFDVKPQTSQAVTDAERIKLAHMVEALEIVSEITIYGADMRQRLIDLLRTFGEMSESEREVFLTAVEAFGTKPTRPW